MTNDPIQTLRWLARPCPIYDDCYIFTVRGRDSRDEIYDWNQLVSPEDHPFFWHIIEDMQDHILRKIT